MPGCNQIITLVDRTYTLHMLRNRLLQLKTESLMFFFHHKFGQPVNPTLAKTAISTKNFKTLMCNNVYCPSLLPQG